MPVLDSAIQQITLKDGRRLGYAEYGTPDGKPIFYFHGNPSSRLEGWRLDEPAKHIKAHIISVDRPGMGLSDFKAGRRLLDWPEDVIELADILGINRFAVLGLSGGGPYAMACAFKIPQRLTAVALISSPCPFNVTAATKDLSRYQRLLIFLVRRAFWLVRLLLRMVARNAHKDPVGFISRVNGKLSDVDKAVVDKIVMRSPEGLNRAVASLQQAFRGGIRGVAWEYSVLMNSWGFRLEDISIPIQLWQGEDDRQIPLSMGRYLATTIPHCRANFLPGEGHYAFFSHVQDILNYLVV